MSTSFTISKHPEPFKKVPALAERLGVAPIPEGDSRPDSFCLYLGSEDGRSYDIFELVNAVLDRIDAASQS